MSSADRDVLAFDDPARGERALLTAALDGDGRAFAALARPHLPMLYRLAARSCGDASLAEDAVQEALASAHERLARYRAGTSFKAFLAAIAVGRARTLLRSEVRRRRREHREHAGGPATPEDHALASDAERQVRDALRAMPNKRRTAALLCWDAGLGNDEIGRLMGLSPAAVRSHLHLATTDLRAAVESAAGVDR